MPSRPARGREPAPHAARRDQLILGPVALEDLPHLEQRGIDEAAIGVALAGRHEARDQARAHVRQIRCDRVGERKLGLAAAEQFGLRLCDERPVDRLDHAARGQRALGAAGAQLDRGQDRLARCVAAIERRKRHAIDADDPHDLLDDVGLALHVGAPGRHGDLDDRAIAGDGEAEMAEDPADLDQRHLDAGQPLHLVERKVDDAVVAMRLADDDGFGRLAAAQVHHQLRCELETRHHERRIDAALEAVARVRIDAELAAGVGDVELVPERGLDQHVGGRLRAAGGFAAHDAGEQFDAASHRRSRRSVSSSV